MGRGALPGVGRGPAGEARGRPPPDRRGRRFGRCAGMPKVGRGGESSGPRPPKGGVHECGVGPPARPKAAAGTRPRRCGAGSLRHVRRRPRHPLGRSSAARIVAPTRINT